MKDVEPILRWVGGKQRLANQLAALVPTDISKRLYVEPFLGAASLFLKLRPKQSLVADLNAQLIATYQRIRDDHEIIARHLTTLRNDDSADHYYKVRETYNASSWSGAQAARFIYLNRTCFNGIFRVNKEGAFNVPYGYKRRPLFPTRSHLGLVADAFEGSTMRTQCFRQTLPNVQKNSFCYLDPPYPPLNGTAFFTHYTSERFAESDQEELGELVREAHRRGAKFLLSNADTPLIRKLYRGFKFIPIEVTRYVTCMKTKHKVSEVAITNCS